MIKKSDFKKLNALDKFVYIRDNFSWVNFINKDDILLLQTPFKDIINKRMKEGDFSPFIFSSFPFILEQIDHELEFLNLTVPEWLEKHKEALSAKINKIKERKNLVEFKDSLLETPKEKVDRILGLASRDKVESLGLNRKQLVHLHCLGYHLGSEEALQQGYNEVYLPLEKEKLDNLKKDISNDYPHLMEVSYKILLEKYYKGFKLREGKNAPKLAKQLSKQGIEYTNEELVYFGEVNTYFETFYSTVSKMYGCTKKRGFYIDIKDFDIPGTVDHLAFSDSCNQYNSSSGADTHTFLKSLSYSMLKSYSIYKDLNGYSLRYCQRAYFFKDEENNISHSGSYSDTSGRNKEGTTAYEFTTVILAILFDKKIGDFIRITGLNIINDDYYNYDEGYTNYIWANCSASSNYTVIGTAKDMLTKFKRNYLIYKASSVSSICSKYDGNEACFDCETYYINLERKGLV